MHFSQQSTRTVICVPAVNAFSGSVEKHISKATAVFAAAVGDRPNFIFNLFPVLNFYFFKICFIYFILKAPIYGM